MRILSLFKSYGFWVLILIAAILIVYKDLPVTFFQQDEWLGLGNNIYYQSKGLTGVIESFFPRDPIQHFTPLAIAYSWVTFFAFGTNFAPYAWISILLHIINSLLLFHFVSRWLNNRKIAFIAGLFFGVNSIPNQAVTWVAAANSYEIPAALTILSLIFFHKFLKEEKNRRVSILLSFLMILVSLLFHENAIFLFIFYPIIFFLFTKSEWKKLFPAFSYAIIIFILAFILVRLPFFFGFSNPLPPATNIDRPPIVVYPYRIISLSMKSFAASFFPQRTLIDISEVVVKLAYPQFIIKPDNVPNPWIAQSIVFDLVSYLLTIIIVCVAFLWLNFVKDRKSRQAAVWSLIFIPLSLIPYAFVLGKSGYASIFETRFLYFSSIGVSIFISLVVYSLILLFRMSKIKTIFLILCVGIYILFHISQTRTQVDSLKKLFGQVKTLVLTVHSSYPDLSKDIIFYTQSDTAYFGMPLNEKMMPTLISFGKILMIWYQEKEKFPGCMYADNYLVDLLTQAYKECEGRGFGYFRDYDKLLNAIKSNKIPSNNVISYSWTGQTESFIDITSLIRNRLKEDIKK